MKRLGRISLCIVSVAVWLACSGCVTGTLWEGDLISAQHRPSNPHSIVLADVPQGDVLVQYDERAPLVSGVTRRAYFLNENSCLIAASKAPHFTTLDQTNNFSLIPIYFEPNAPTNSDPWLGTIATVSSNRMSFTILRPDQPPDGPHKLPVYRGADGIFIYAALTPATIALDVFCLVGAAYGASPYTPGITAYHK